MRICIVFCLFLLQPLAQHLTCLLRVCLATAGLHHLADEGVERLVLACLELRHAGGVGSNYLVHNFFQRGAIGGLRQPFFRTSVS